MLDHFSNLRFNSVERVDFFAHLRNAFVHNCNDVVKRDHVGFRSVAAGCKLPVHACRLVLGIAESLHRLASQRLDVSLDVFHTCKTVCKIVINFLHPCRELARECLLLREFLRNHVNDLVHGVDLVCKKLVEHLLLCYLLDNWRKINSLLRCRDCRSWKVFNLFDLLEKLVLHCVSALDVRLQNEDVFAYESEPLLESSWQNETRLRRTPDTDCDCVSSVSLVWNEVLHYRSVCRLHCYRISFLIVNNAYELRCVCFRNLLV